MGAIATNFSRHMHVERAVPVLLPSGTCHAHMDLKKELFFCFSWNSCVQCTEFTCTAMALLFTARSVSFTQTGPAFILGSRLAGQWKRYRADFAVLSDIGKEMAGHSDSDIEMA